MLSAPVFYAGALNFFTQNMKKSILFIFNSLFTIFLLSGCMTFNSTEKRDEVAEVRSTVGQEIAKIREDINALKGQIDELNYKINKISQTQNQQSNEINATLNEWKKQNQNDMNKKISSIDAALQKIEKKQDQDKKELENKMKIIIDEVSRENQELRKQINSIKKPSSAPSARQTSPQTRSTDNSGTYTVVAGDTLAKIAQSFGISLKNIMETNNIDDPNSIRIGQKIIIPKTQE